MRRVIVRARLARSIVDATLVLDRADSAKHWLVTAARDAELDVDEGASRRGGTGRAGRHKEA